MSFCPNCGFNIETDSKFCPSCGANVAPQEEQIPVAAQPVYAQPVSAPPRTSGGAVAKGIIGMIMGIGTLILAFIGLIYTLISLPVPGLGFGMAIGFAIFCLPLSIVGRILCVSSKNSGNPSGTCTAGAVLSMVALILTCVMLFFGLINLT